jgi:hemerythrin-like domain-containing protein
MQAMADVLELLTEQHRHIEQLLERARTGVEGRSATVDELVDYVTAHLAVEQELFYPCVTRRLSQAVQDELAAEHAEIRRILADLLWLDAEDDRFAVTLAMLEQLLEGHCAWQDQELFERLAEELAPAARRDLGASVRDGFAMLRGGDIAHAA